MKINYDKIADAVYVRFGKGKVATTTQISEKMLVDKDTKGNVLGIEILSKTLVAA